MVPADGPEQASLSQLIRKNGVRYRTDWEYILHGGNVTNERIKKQVHRYDSYGRIDETITLDPSENTKSILIYEYLPDNRLSRITEHLPEGQVLSRVEYTYDSMSRLKAIEWFSGQGFLYSKKSFEVDEGSSCVKQFNWYSPDSVLSKQHFYYTGLQEGHIWKIEEYEGKDELRVQRIIELNENEKTDLERFLNNKDELLYYLKYNYDPHGKLSSKVRIYPTGKRVREAEYNFSPGGLLTGEVIYNQLGEIVRYYRYAYD